MSNTICGSCVFRQGLHPTRCASCGPGGAYQRYERSTIVLKSDPEAAHVEAVPVAPIGHNGPPEPVLDPTLTLPDADELRGAFPMASGLLDYFPAALAEVSRVSKIGNDQHNPGMEMHWARDKSTDHADKIMRHLTDRGKFDGRGVRHTARLAWRALAMLQTELEMEAGYPLSRASVGAPPGFLGATA